MPPSSNPLDHKPADRQRAEAKATPENFGQQTDNEAKYARTGRVETIVLERFRAGLVAELERLRPASILDAGCGEGQLAAALASAAPEAELVGVDGRPEALRAFRSRNPGARAVEADLSNLPFTDRAFDLVVCSEVLEHLRDPRQVLRELGRVSRDHLLLTVPHEPFFRVGNLAAGRYLSRLGSTPGHLWTWGRRSFLRMVRGEAEPVRWISLFPWQAVVARPREARANHPPQD